jgi:hypothetical protein
VRTIGIAAFCLCLAACGGGSGSGQASNTSPTAPSTVSPQGQPTGSGVVPNPVNYQGRWAGDFTVTACDGGPYVSTTKLCVAQFSVGSAIPVSVLLIQGPDRVTGTVAMTGASSASGVWSTNFMGNLVGAFDGNGGLSLLGALLGAQAERNGSVFKVTVRNWVASVSGNQLLSTWTMDFRQDGVGGIGTVVATTPGLTLVQ